jgi:hypothetical protein
MTPKTTPVACSNLGELHSAIARAAAEGATYTWIAGVLAGCLAEEIPTAEARSVAIATLSSPPIRPARRRAA